MHTLHDAVRGMGQEHTDNDLPVILLGRLWFFGHIKRNKICENTMSPLLLGAGAGAGAGGCGCFLGLSRPEEDNNNIIHMYTLMQQVYTFMHYRLYSRHTYARMLGLMYYTNLSICIHTYMLYICTYILHIVHIYVCTYCIFCKDTDHVRT